LTVETASDSCSSSSVDFSVGPTDTEICMDVTSMIFGLLTRRLNNGRRDRRLRGSFHDYERSLEDESKNNLVMMIDATDTEDNTGAGDRFYTSDNDDSESRPSLLVEGKELDDCTTIVDYVCSDDNFSVLCSMLQDTGLDAVLDDNREKFTLFAPQNSDALQSIDTSDIGAVVNLLKYHVVYGYAIRSSEIGCENESLPLSMSNGNSTTIICTEDTLFIEGDGNAISGLPEITTADIETCNGIVHKIDNPILPLVDVDIVEEDCQTLLELVCSKEDISAICQLATAFGDDPLVVELLNGLNTDVYTVFLPNNDAALELMGIATDTEAITNLLSHHAIPSVILLAEDLECGEELTMVKGGTTTHVCEGENVFQVGKGNVEDGDMPQIVEANIQTCTGVVHIVDRIIKPSESASTPPEELEGEGEGEGKGEGEGEQENEEIETEAIET